MEHVRRHLREAWAGSKTFRIVLIVAIVYAVLRLVVHGAYLGMMLYPNSGLLGGTPEWAGGGGEPMVPVDLQIYLDAAQRFQAHQPLYTQPDRIEVYQYPPIFALAFVPFLGLHPVATAVIHSVIHLVAYGLLYAVWADLFDWLGLERAAGMMVWTLPLWLVFSSFWSDLGYLNIYIIVALFASLLVANVLKERVWRSALWLTVILQIKPHWAFAAALPLLLGRFRFLLKLAAVTAAFTLAVVGAAVLAGGWQYLWQQHVAYARFLPQLVTNFPWRDPKSGFLGYNHSIKQVVFYLLGVSEPARRVAAAIKALLVAPLGVVGWRAIVNSSGDPAWRAPKLALDLTLSLYLATFICLDMVWEASLTVALFPYLLGTLERRWLRALAGLVFVPYALIDMWQLISFAAFGMDVIDPGLYVLTDPSIYLPLVMIVIVAFYLLLLRRLWKEAPAYLSTEAIP